MIKKKKSNIGGIAVAAGVVGAAVGAAAVAFSDPKNREKAKEAINNSGKLINDAKNKFESEKKTAVTKAKKEAEKITDTADKTKEKIEKEAKKLKE